MTENGYKYQFST